MAYDGLGHLQGSCILSFSGSHPCTQEVYILLNFSLPAVNLPYINLSDQPKNLEGKKEKMFLPNSVCNLTQFWHYLPGYSIRSHRLRAQSHKTALPRLQMSNAKLSLVLSTNWLNKSEVPITLSLGSSNLLEQLTDLRKTLYLLDYCFIIKRCNSGTTRCIEQGRWEGARSFHALSGCARLPVPPPT